MVTRLIKISDCCLILEIYHSDTMIFDYYVQIDNDDYFEKKISVPDRFTDKQLELMYVEGLLEN